MTENEKKLLDLVLVAVAENGYVTNACREMVRAVQMERTSDTAQDAYKQAAIRYLREQRLFNESVSQLQIPDFIRIKIFDEAQSVVKAEPSMAKSEAMTPEKLKAYTGRDFGR